jgi:hypothetical protein
MGILVNNSLSRSERAQSNRRRQARFIRWLAVLALLSITRCAFDVVQLRQLPAQWQEAPPSRQVWTLEESVRVKLVSGWASALKKGTTWRLVGRIEQGDVFKTKDQVVTVEASNMYEAEPVVSDGRLVGFFLIIEKTFTPADPPKPLRLTAAEGSG